MRLDRAPDDLGRSAPDRTIYRGREAARRALRIGFVATRLGGTDGVSLEAEKWADVLCDLGHDVFYFAGVVDRPAEKSRVAPEAFFGDPDVAHINAAVFGKRGGAA